MKLTTTNTVQNLFSKGDIMSNNFSAVDSLGVLAGNTAMVGCANYIRANALKVADLDRLVAILKVHAKSAVDTAMADAKLALDANMGAAAEATFLASFTVAGIAAAKEYFAS